MGLTRERNVSDYFEEKVTESQLETSFCLFQSGMTDVADKLENVGANSCVAQL